MKNADEVYKLMPPNIKPRAKTDRYYPSPEEYDRKNFRSPLEKKSNETRFELMRRLQKEEVFSVGM